jgi:hypothetical protein
MANNHELIKQNYELLKQSMSKPLEQHGRSSIAEYSTLSYGNGRYSIPIKERTGTKWIETDEIGFRHIFGLPFNQTPNVNSGEEK